ncbi:MAG TPA: arylesterase [Burkholderiales bacterium]|jgi:lysophospholipase L1-like esterase|nr:arylesterase [Burkholderiales bacterium]
MRFRRLLATLTVALALAACSDAPPPLPRLGADDVVLAFGDSITYGTGANPEESYPEVLAQLIGRRVVGAGVPGEVTANGVQRLPEVLDEVKPKILLLCMGGNDMLRKVEPVAIESNLRTMVSMARDRGIGVVLIAVPKPALFSGNAAFYQTISKENDLPLEGGILKDILFDNEFKADPIHPNAKGYRRMAEAIAELLRRAGAV